MAIAHTFRYRVVLVPDTPAVWTGIAEELSDRNRPVAAPFGTRPSVTLSSDGLVLCTDRAERPRAWHFGDASLRRPSLAEGRVAEAGSVVSLLEPADELGFALSMNGVLTFTLRRSRELFFAVGERWGIGSTGVSAVDEWLSQPHSSLTPEWKPFEPFVGRVTAPDDTSHRPGARSSIVALVRKSQGREPEALSGIVDALTGAHLTSTPW